MGTRRKWPVRDLGDLPPPGKRPERSGTEAWDRHPLASTTLCDGASGRRQRASGGAQGLERGSLQNPWRVVSASIEYRVPYAQRCPGRVAIEFQ